MGILLEGINIPEGNPITINIYRDGTWVNAYTTEDGNAIKVPEPHGRLIDASALEREISRWIPHPDKYINKRNSDFLYYIKDTPTIVEADCPPSTPLEQVWTEVFGEEGE